MKELKKGDVVQLRTGGCLMTVSEVNLLADKHQVECVWFDDEGELKSDFFRREVVRRVTIEE